MSIFNSGLSLGGVKTNFKCKHSTDVLKLLKSENIQVVDCCFTDPLGVWNHCHFMANQFDEHTFEDGLPFDGSSIKLFRSIDESDMLMKPDPSTAWIDPFQKYKTLHLTCGIYEPVSDGRKPYDRDPRSTALRAEAYLRDTGIADTCYFGPEAECFIFDDIRYTVQNHTASFIVDGHEGYWNSNVDTIHDKDGKSNNLAHRVPAKNWYFPVSPIDSLVDIRTEMLITMSRLGVPVEKHHHEVATCQLELGFSAMPLTACADNLQTYKYVVKNVAKSHNKTATFMAKPLKGDNGTGMHCHQSLWKAGKPLFYDSKSDYVGLSDMCKWYIGGILKHAPALCAFTNPTTNSYKRLVPGFEAPTNLVFSKGNRSAAVRIPMYHPNVPKLKRLEFRVPDPTCNPYNAFAAMLMAGLDGIQNKIDPGKPVDVDIYEMKPAQLKSMKQTPRSLGNALQHLKSDCGFLLKGGVFSQSFIDAYIEFKIQEQYNVDVTPHPLEFQYYYHL